MRRRFAFSLPMAALAAALVLPGFAHAETDAAALDALSRMSTSLAQLERFRVSVDTSYDVVQEWGQKIEYGETRTVTVERPGRARMETTDRNGERSGVLFDGETITAWDSAREVYASIEQPGSLEVALEHFVEDLRMDLPMAPLLRPDLLARLRGWAEEIRFVESSSVAGTPAMHVALRGAREDVQLWIGASAPHLPLRMVITYKRAEGEPQFRASFGTWDTAVEIGSDTFAYTPDDDMTRIAFRPQALLSGGGAKSGAQP